MSKILTVLALIVCLATLAPHATAAPPSNGGIAIPVSGTGSFNNVAGTFSGTFHLTGFSVQNGKTVANGLLSGILTTASGSTSVLATVTAAVTPPSGSTCNILNLVIGSIHLDLLGLIVDTNQIVVDITAQSGPGNLLGNLLCDVSNLLNNPSQTLADTLNHILSILVGL